MELELRPLALPGIPKERPIVIAGPWSAETEEQVMNTATALANKGVKIFRDFYIDMDLKPYFIPRVIIHSRYIQITQEVHRCQIKELLM